MPAAQALLLPDPHPLDERLGTPFFRQAPETPGVYLMRDKNDRVLYVGKAKNLRQRLNTYRLANPDRMARRHLRLVRQVARIEFELCPDESAALAREAKLLRELKPQFNRAGVWPGKTRFVVWRLANGHLELGVVETPAPGWHRFGPLNSAARYLRGSLVRLLWLALHPRTSVQSLPAGWNEGQFAEIIAIPCPTTAGELTALLAGFFWETNDALPVWLQQQFAERVHPFERAFINAELEALREFQPDKPSRQTNQLALL